MADPTKSEIITAIEDCIEHWNRAVRDEDGEYCDDGVECDGGNCALCKLFSNDHTCSGCPLMIYEDPDSDCDDSGCDANISAYVRVQMRGYDKQFMLNALTGALKMVKEEW